MPGSAGHLNGVCVYGLLFLPAAGRAAPDIKDVGSYVRHLTSTARSDVYVYILYGSPSVFSSNGVERWQRQSIRLASVVSELAYVCSCLLRGIGIMDLSVVPVGLCANVRQLWAQMPRIQGV